MLGMDVPAWIRYLPTECPVRFVMGLKPLFFMWFSIIWPILPIVMSACMFSMAVCSAVSAVAAIVLCSLLKHAVKAVSVTYPSICTPMSTLTIEFGGIFVWSFGGEV